MELVVVVGGSSGLEGWCQQVLHHQFAASRAAGFWRWLLPVCGCACAWMDGVVREWGVNTLPMPMIGGCVLSWSLCK